MNTQSFIQTLESYPTRPLVFDYGSGRRVAPGYHVTEVMNVTYETMDCGGQANFWRETVVQLQGPSAKDAPEFMTTDKFLGIYRRVVASVPVRPDSEVRLEYGDALSPAIRYHVGAVAESEGHLVIFLTSPGVTCKADSSCCGPSPSVRPNLQLDEGLELQVVGAAKGSSCC